MPSTFFGLDIAHRALQAARSAFETSQHNIGNANTPGYSRQTNKLNTFYPYTEPATTHPKAPGQLGSGVHTVEIQRAMDMLLWKREFEQNQNMGSWESRKELLSLAEGYFDDSTDTGMKSLLSTFWNDWQEVAKFPESTGARQKLLEDADELAKKFQAAYTNLTDLRRQADSMVSDKVGKINDLAAQIASLNNAISKATGIGDNPNDLLDKRDQLVMELAKEVNVTIASQPSGSVYLYIGGMTLVEDDKYNTLKTVLKADINPLDPDPDRAILSDVRWDDGTPLGQPVTVNNGDLYGVLTARDTAVKGYRDNLDTLAQSVMNEVNTRQTAGYDLNGDLGLNFFNGANAKFMTAAITDPLLVAAATTRQAPGVPNPGDGSNALSIAQLVSAKLMSGSSETMDEYYSAKLAGQVGIDINVADRSYTSQSLLLEQIQSQQQQVSGVNMDEEFLTITKFQRQYEAASRLISNYDDMINRVINNMGRVGL